jgi:Gluconate 2-dehydrogenase subunit 3
MRDLYPGYDVLAKRHTASWNEKTRRVIDERLAVDPSAHAFFGDQEWRSLCAVCDRIVPQPADRVAAVPVAALIDRKLVRGWHEGYRDAGLPRPREAWKRGLDALQSESVQLHGQPFAALAAAEQDGLLKRMQNGELHHPAWGGMSCALFFKKRLLPDIVMTYYSHPTAWNEIGWGGPASPRGYVRMRPDRRDPWEAAEAKPGRERDAYRENRRVAG